MIYMYIYIYIYTVCVETKMNNLVVLLNQLKLDQQDHAYYKLIQKWLWFLQQSERVIGMR